LGGRFAGTRTGAAGCFGRGRAFLKRFDRRQRILSFVIPLLGAGPAASPSGRRHPHLAGSSLSRCRTQPIGFGLGGRLGRRFCRGGADRRDRVLLNRVHEFVAE
jgi:hypothetical protein